MFLYEAHYTQPLHDKRIEFMQVKRQLLWLLALLLAACGPINLPFGKPAPTPDPLAVYRPAFDPQALPADFAVDKAPRYAITMRVDPEKRTVEGVARLTFRNLSGAPMSDVFVRLYPNLQQLLGSMTLSGVTTLPDHYGVGFAFAAENTAARLTLTNPLPPEKSLTLQIKYTVQGPPVVERPGYVLFGENQGILSLPYAYPMLAAQTGLPTDPWRLDIPPSFGDIAISDPSFYWITATVPADYMLVSSGVNGRWCSAGNLPSAARRWKACASTAFISRTIAGRAKKPWARPRPPCASTTACSGPILSGNSISWKHPPAIWAWNIRA